MTTSGRLSVVCLVSLLASGRGMLGVDRSSFATTSLPAQQQNPSASLFVQSAAATPAAQSPANESELKRLVVMIRATAAGVPVVGAGIIVAMRNDRLYIATANHVVRSIGGAGEDVTAQNIQVMLSWLPGESVAGTLLSHSDGPLDLAVLAVAGASRLSIPALPWAVLVQPESLTPGESVAPVGQPLGEAWFVPRRRHLVSSVGSQTINTEGELVRGHSGGALVTDDWGIAGLVRREGALVGESTRIDLAIEQLRRWGYPLDVTFRTHRATGATAASYTLAQERQEVGSLVSRFVVAYNSRDYSTIANIVGTPFYQSRQVTLTTEAFIDGLRAKFGRGSVGPLIVRSLKVRTIGELKADGLEPGFDRMVSDVNGADSDWIIDAAILREGSPDGRMVFVVRRINGVLKIVGGGG